MDNNHTIQVTPNVIEFFDAEPNVVHQMVVNIQNVSRASQSVHVQEPKSKEFKLICKEKDVVLAPGLSISGIIEYISKDNKDCSEYLVVNVNQQTCGVPLKAYALKPDIQVNGNISFGKHINDGQTKFAEVTIANFGSTDGQFSITYDGIHPLTFHPKTGSVKAGYSLKVKFQLLCNFIGDVSEDINFDIEGKPLLLLNATATIMMQKLVLLNTNSKELTTCVDFGAAYYGCDVIRSCVIRNDCPVESNYVIIMEEDSDGQEIGVDLTKKISTCLSDVIMVDEGQSSNNLLSLFTAMPSQGSLAPYEEQTIYFKFSPFQNEIDKGFSITGSKPPRRDYSIFMTVELVGTVSSIEGENQKTEIALIGSALPIEVSLIPKSIPTFDRCAVGSVTKSTCKLYNSSNQLPVDFLISKPAHFKVIPDKGIIEPSNSLTLCVEFCPRQVGTFKKPAYVNIFGSSTKTNKSKLLSEKKIIKTLEINLKGICDAGLSFKHANAPDVVKDCKKMPGNTLDAIIAQPDDRANSIRPSNRNETIRTKYTNVERYSYVDRDYAYTLKEEQERAEHKKKYDEYIKQQQKDKLDKKRESEHLKSDNQIDLGIIPSKGMTPPRLSIKHVPTKNNSHTQVDNSNIPPPLSSKKLSSERRRTSKQNPIKGLNAVPGNEREKKECQNKLSPQEQYMIEIEPKILDFGDVCLKSACTRKLRICNNLNNAIHIQFQVSLSELRQTSPLSQVVPPRSVAQLEFHFESNTLGKFERSCPYVINGHHQRHVIVLANVIRVSLSLSSNDVHLDPSSVLPIESGLRGTVTLINNQNMAAEFNWSPVFNEQGTSFSMRPSKGVVDAFSYLDCEMVFYPSFSANLQGDFILKVHGGEENKLHCTAELGQSTCAFVERRLLFGAVPLLLATAKTALLRNTGQHHAFFSIVDESPIPGMCISPLEGVVPAGGVAEIKVKYVPEIIQKFDTHMHVEIRGWRRLSLRMGGQSEAPCLEINVVKYVPEIIQKFDTHMHVEIRGWRRLSLRMGGQSEAPCLEINVPNFQFSGVYCGSVSTIAFTLTNKARSRANVVFDLSRFSDFRLHIKDEENLYDDAVLQMEGVTFLSVVGMRTVNCLLEFSPSEVASYDFIMPVCVNNMAAPSPPSTPFGQSINSSRYSCPATLSGKGGSYLTDVAMKTPCRRIQATALCPPMELSSEILSFHLPSGYHDLGIEDASGCRNAIMFKNVSDKKLTFDLDLSSYKRDNGSSVFRFLHNTGSPYTTNEAQKNLTQAVHLDSGELYQLSVLFTPEIPGHFKWSIPVLLNGIHTYPYRILTFDALMEKPEVICNPEKIVFEAVPLATELSKTVILTAHGYRKASKLTATVGDVELFDGSQHPIFAVNFIDKCFIDPCCGDFGGKEVSVLTCTITFKSPKPVSVVTEVVFCDEEGGRYKLPLVATADNCLLSTSEFMSINQADYQIIRDINNEAPIINSNHAKYGEINYRRCPLPAAIITSQPTSATTTSFGLSVSSYDESNDSSDSASSVTTDKSVSRAGSASKGIEREGTFLREDSIEKRHLSEISRTIQRWYSSQGWAGGAQPIAIPESLRSCFTIPDVDATPTRSGSWDRDGRRNSRSIFDVVYHFSCKSIPGIPQNITLPNVRNERVKQLHVFYTTLIQYLSCQGAMLACLQAENLLEPDDYLIWKQQCSSNDSYLMKNDITIQEFESISQKAWTTILLQVYKLFVLNRITVSQFIKSSNNLSITQLESFNRDPICSNVYSTSERVVLSWLNQHYNEQRNHTCFTKLSIGGQAPLSRWIVNFDYDLMDGLVFASLLLAYIPYIASTELKSLYTRPKTAEQCLHNALKITSIIRKIGLDFDIIGTDITEPISVNLLLFCVYLYRRLPHYIPKTNVTFKCKLHSTVSQKIKLQNPSSKPLHYQVMIEGKEADDFSTPQYNVQVPPKSEVLVPISYKNRFIRRCSAVVMFVGKRIGSPVGSTLVFALDTITEKISTQGAFVCESPCYTLAKVPITVKNPFGQASNFQIVLVETKAARLSKEAQRPSRQHKEKIKMQAKHSNQKLFAKKAVKSGALATSSLDNIKSNVEIKVDAQYTEEEISFKSFWCAKTDIYLEPHDIVALDINFLPFSIGQRQCSILFINDAIGEFVYSIEGEGMLPSPIDVPYQSDVFTTDANANNTVGNRKSVENVVNFKCSDTKGFSKQVKMFCTNQSRENALMTAAKQSMTQEEQQRRQLTGVISSNTVSNMLNDLVLSDQPIVASSPIKIKAVDGVTDFSLITTSKYFTVPEQIAIPNYLHDNKETFEIPLSFTPDGPGHYSTMLIIRAPGDVRVMRLESTVSPDGTMAELQFTCQAHQSVTQEIPLINNTDSDWQMETALLAEGFHCPGNFIAHRQGTTAMPLEFSPSYEKLTSGQLKLFNHTNGSTMLFTLIGSVEPPKQLGDLKFNCIVNKESSYVIDVANRTNRKLSFKVFSDVPFLSGCSSIAVLPSHVGKLRVTAQPLQRGCYEGVIWFVSDESINVNENNQSIYDDSDSSDDEGFHRRPSSAISKQTSYFSSLFDMPAFVKPFRLWYKISMNVEPSGPVDQLHITCFARSLKHIVIPVNNPTSNQLSYNVIVDGEQLSGVSEITILPYTEKMYNCTFAPVRAGQFHGSVTLQNESLPELWYDVILTATRPEPIALPRLECTLGKSCCSTIPLDNPCNDPVEMTVTCSNTLNYDINYSKVQTDGYSSIEVPFLFTPSTLGSVQSCEISFYSEKLGEISYIVHGAGHPPTRDDDEHVIETILGGSSSTILSFFNPFEWDANVSVTLQPSNYTNDLVGTTSDVISFFLMIRRNEVIPVLARQHLEIPMCFSPTEMRRHECICSVKCTPLHEADAGQQSLEWRIPITGIPLYLPLSNSQVVTHLQCKSRERTQEKVEIILDTHARVHEDYRCPTPVHLLGDFVKLPSSDGVSKEYGELFDHELLFNENVTSTITDSIAFRLLQTEFRNDGAIISLTFEIIFQPRKSFRTEACLKIHSPKRGIWKFPFRFTSSSPEPEDVIIIEANGLNKTSCVSFRLTSTTKEHVEFVSMLLGGSHDSFSVKPLAGELPPEGSDGCLISLGYTPSTYGKDHQTTLLIQTQSTQWTYEVKGSTPSYIKPSPSKSIDCENENYEYSKRQKSPTKNFIKSNLNVNSTGPSSPIKLMPLVKQK